MVFMDINTVIGLIVLPAAVLALTGLTWWSRNRINKINDAGPASARAILRGQAGDDNDGR